MTAPAPDANTEKSVNPPTGASSAAPESAAAGNSSPPAVPDYDLLKRIGEGGYGEVWLARNITGTLRAIKVVHRHAFENDRPFEREFEGIRRFEPVSQSHESQLKIFHVGRRDGYFYYVMELADDASAEPKAESRNPKEILIPESESSVGKELVRTSGFGFPSDLESRSSDFCTHYTAKTLRQVLQNRGRLAMDEALEISLKLTEALAHLHRHGLVHRDIKPSNIIFVNGQAKLADIGLVAESEGTLTFVGTEGYVPPEGPGKPPADIFSLGKVLYEISTGQDRNQFPALPTCWNSDVEREAFAEFNEVLVRACAPVTEQRYSTAEQMHGDLLLLRAGKSLSRLRVLERRLARLAKLSVAAIALSAVMVGGYFYQRHQTRTSKRLTAQLQVNNGLRLLDEGDFQGSLLWFAEALESGQAYWNADEQKQHRLRFGAILQQCPKLVHVIRPEMRSENPLLEFLPQTLTQVISPGATGAKVRDDTAGAASFSPDGRQILISGYGRTVLLCDVATGRTLQRLEHQDHVKSAGYTGDGRRIMTALATGISGIAGEVQIWDASTGQRVGEPLIHQDNNSSAISHDGRRVLTVSLREAQVWDADTSQKLFPPFVPNGFFAAGSFSRDGRRVLTVTRPTKAHTNGLVQIWDASTGAKLGPSMAGMRAVLSRDGTRVLTRGGEEASVWDAVSGQKLLTIPAKPAQGGDALFTSDGQRIVLTQWFDGLIQVYDAATGAQIGPTIQQENGCHGKTLSPDGMRLASYCGHHIHVWNLFTGQPSVRPIPTNDRCDLEFSPDGRHLLVAGGENDPVVRLWDFSTEPTLAPMTHDGWVFHAAFSPDGRRIVTASGDETARTWDAATGRAVGPPLHTNHTSDYLLFAASASERIKHPATGQFVLSFPSTLGGTNVFHPVLGDKIGMLEPSRYLPSTSRAVFFATFAPDSKRVVTTSYDGTARVWEAETGRELIPPLKHQAAIFHAAFSPDGRRIVTASADWTAQVWDAHSGRRVGPALQHRGAVLYAEFSPAGRAVLTASYDSTAQVWKVETGKKMGPALQHPNDDNGPVFVAKFSPDGQQILTASYDRTAQLWDARTGRKTAPPLRHRSFVFHAEFSADGKRVVTASGDAQVWNTVTGARMAPPIPHAGVVNYATFSRDGKRIVTASFDGTARVWEVSTSQSLTPPLRHADRVWHAEFSPEGRYVLTASSDGSARLWPLTEIDGPATDLRLLAQTLAGRQIDHTGSLLALPPKTLEANWRKLRNKSF